MTAGPVSAEFTAETAKQLARTGAALAEEPTSEPVEAAQSSGPEHEQARRRNVEAVIQAAARWGWDQAQSQMWSGFPTPIVDWTDDGQPFILAGKVVNPGDTIAHVGVDGQLRARTNVQPPDDALLKPP